MRRYLYGFSLFVIICFTGCARYHSQSPVQEQNMLPTRYQTNVNHTNPLYNHNANFITRKTPNSGVRMEKEIAQKILERYPQLQSVSVVIIKNRAYVAVSLHPNVSTLGSLRVEIPALVKDMDAVVEKVYVSDNPNFRNRLERQRRNR